MMMNQPIVSVIIPVLNTRPYLRQCLESVSAQTLPETEVICVDNGSTDGSYEFLLEYAKDHSNVTVLRHAAGRQGGARNVGIARARGEYIGFVDSDDFVAPTMFAEMVKAAQTGRADVAVCNFERYYEGKGRRPQALDPRLLGSGNAFRIQERPRLLRNLTICNKLVSRELIERHAIRLPEGVYHEDQVFVVACLVLASRIVGVPQPLYFYRRGRPGSVNECRGAEHLEIFAVMDMIDDVVAKAELGVRYRELIDELKISRLLLISNLIGKRYRRGYFEQMRREVQSLEIGTAPVLLTPTEHREYRIVRRHGFLAYRAFLAARKTYSHLRRLGKGRGRSSTCNDLGLGAK